MRGYQDYLNDIVTSMQNCLDFVSGLTYEEFARDKKTNAAVIRMLEVIGEAVIKIPPEAKSKYVDIPWIDIAAMRNKLIHEYFGVDLEIVWDTVKEDVPALLPMFKRMADKETQG
jgi:uncharacterized protein with HEPN domain